MAVRYRMARWPHRAAHLHDVAQGFSQVVLSLQLPFAVVPLVMIAADRARMGDLRAPGWLVAVASLIATVIVVLNAKLIFDVAGIPA